MEERRDPTLAENVGWSKSCVKIALIAVLFISGLLLSPSDFLTAKKPDTNDPASAAIKQRHKGLLKIYSILKSNRPDMEEPEAWKISSAILRESTRYSFDPILILAVIDVESKFQHAAVSPAGARGLMQIMPSTGKALIQEIGLASASLSRGFQVELLDDPLLNIKLGIHYLHALKTYFQNLTIALIAYNLGPTELQNRLKNEIGFSLDYAAGVLSTYHKYKTLTPPTF